MAFAAVDQVVSEPDVERAAAPSLQSRRSLLAAGLSGLVGLLTGTLARPRSAEAVAGSPLIVGQLNMSSTSIPPAATSPRRSTMPPTITGHR